MQYAERLLRVPMVRGGAESGPRRAREQRGKHIWREGKRTGRNRAKQTCRASKENVRKKKEEQKKQ